MRLMQSHLTIIKDIIELNCAKWQADNFKCLSHRIFKLDFWRLIITDNIDVPKNENIKNIDNGIPTPMFSRNINLSFASGCEIKNR